MFGLAGPQGNHGEDVKEYWWYLDGTPTHSWNTWRYHYPQREFPYGDLVAENARRGKLEPEYELVDTGIFDESRYWVVTVDYAKAAPRDLLMRITVENAGPQEATLDVLPTLWFRNTWSWGYDDHPKPTLRADGNRIVGSHSAVGTAGAGRRRHPGIVVLRQRDQRRPAVRRAEHHAVPEGRHRRPRAARGADRQPACRRAPRPRCATGSPCRPAGRRPSRSGWSGCRIRPWTSTRWRPSVEPIDLGKGYDTVVANRKKEADAFYASVIPSTTTAAEARWRGRRSPGCCGASNSSITT